MNLWIFFTKKKQYIINNARLKQIFSYNSCYIFYMRVSDWAEMELSVKCLLKSELIYNILNYRGCNWMEFCILRLPIDKCASVSILSSLSSKSLPLISPAKQKIKERNNLLLDSIFNTKNFNLTIVSNT